MSLESEPRHIRSFSGRRGHFTSGQRSAYDALLPTYGIGFTRQPLDAQATFGRQGPLVLEIGFGMGETTAAIALAQPHRNFIGVEVYPAGVGALLRRIEEAAKFVPLERLALSPQCGFASTIGGNKLTEDDERRKLALVVETAREVWG